MCLEAQNLRLNKSIEMAYLITGWGLLVSKAGTVSFVLIAYSIGLA
jgi:hypothetical protein